MPRCYANSARLQHAQAESGRGTSHYIQNLGVGASGQPRNTFIQNADLTYPRKSVTEITKKTSGNLGLAAVYERLFERYLSVARERETAAVGDAQRIKNANALSAADVALRLLGTSIGEPCSVDGSET